jgi:hypothetical protein
MARRTSSFSRTDFMENTLDLRTRSTTRRWVRNLALISTAAPPFVLALPACGDTINHFNTYSQGGPQGGGEAGATGGLGGAAGEMTATSGEAGAAGIVGGAAGGMTATGDALGGAGGVPDEAHSPYPDAPRADTAVADQELDLFGTIGAKLWFGVQAEQLELMNRRGTSDFYFPNPDWQSPFVDHLWITAPGENGTTADYGKVKVKVAGQSTRRDWSKDSIPNLNIDSDDFVEHQLIGGYEHLRINNAQVGGIFREWLSLEMFEKLDYPAARASFVWASSNVWATGVQIPMVLVERYKRQFCKRFPEFGGDCANLWEFDGGFTNGGADSSVFDDEAACRLEECDAARAKEMQALVSETPAAEGYKAALAAYIDWPAFHRFQCLSWVLATGDDAVHNLRNVVVVEGVDGKFRFLPYSTDISLGHERYATVNLHGNSVLALGCQADASCWADTLAMCEAVLTEFTVLEPVGVLDDLRMMLNDGGMLREGDQSQYDFLRDWLQRRLADMPGELEQYRDGQAECDGDEVDCGGFCALDCGPI